MGINKEFSSRVKPIVEARGFSFGQKILFIWPILSKIVAMKAVILAAGRGTRMRELTNELPKPMLQVHGQPILEHIVEGLIAAEVRGIFIVTGFRGEVIENHFGSGQKWGVKIFCGRQVVQDGTGKAPELAKSFVAASPFFLTYGDILVKPETYQRMIKRYNEG